MKKHDNKVCCIGFLFRKISIGFSGPKSIRNEIKILGTKKYDSQYIGLISGSGNISENPDEIMKRSFFNKTDVIPEKVIKVFENVKDDGCKNFFYLIVEERSNFSIYKEIKNNDTYYIDTIVSFHDICDLLRNIDKEKHLEPLLKAFQKLCEIDKTFSRNVL